MEFPLVVKSKLDWNLYKQFTWLIFWKSKFLRILLIIMELIGLLSLILWMLEQDSQMLACAVFCMVFYPFLLIGMFYLKARNIYYKNPTIQEQEVQISFDEEGFEATTPKGYSHHAYTELTAIYENKALYALMLGKNIGQVIRKEDCSPEVLAWIEQLKGKISKK